MSQKCAKGAKKFCTLYAWPYRKEKPIIEPSEFWRCPISGRLYPVYKRSECTELFLAPVHRSRLAEYNEPDEEFEVVRIAVNKTDDKQNVDDNYGTTDLLQNAEEKPYSYEELPNNDIRVLHHNSVQENSKANGYVKNKKPAWCSFCKSNGETPEFFRSHNITTKKGDYKVTCPVLRQFSCPICKATGDNAHTVRYCPLRPEEEQRNDREVFPRFVRSATGKIKICRH